MRVTLIKSRLNYRGGLEKYTVRLARAFKMNGCDVEVLTTGEKPSLDHIRVTSLMPDSKFSLWHHIAFGAACKKWVACHGYDILFAMERVVPYTHFRVGEGIHAAYLKQRQLVEPWGKRVSVKINPLQHYLLRLERSIFERSERTQIFTNSEMVKHEIVRHYQVAAQNISVFHNGVEWMELKAPFDETFAKKRAGPHHFLFVGNGYRRKGLNFLLDALARLKNREWVLTIVGREKNLSLFQKKARGLKLEKQISFLGEQHSLIPFYQAADTLVIPSLYDPFANVTVEALAMGLFVITSPFNGGKEILTSKTGQVIENLFSPESFEHSLQKAIELPKTYERASHIRMSIKELDFSTQLNKLVRATCT